MNLNCFGTFTATVLLNINYFKSKSSKLTTHTHAVASPLSVKMWIPVKLISTIKFGFWATDTTVRWGLIKYFYCYNYFHLKSQLALFHKLFKCGAVKLCNPKPGKIYAIFFLYDEIYPDKLLLN